MTGSVTTLTYRELLDQVARFAGALRHHGVGYGDRVIIYMPMVPEALVAMLGCARIGAVHSVVFGGFASNELAARISDAGKPGLGILRHRSGPRDSVQAAPGWRDRACGAQAGEEHHPGAPAGQAEMLPRRDLDWDEIMADAAPAGCVPVAATDLYILYTSGTTGQPKGIVRDNGGHAVALRWSMENIYDVRPGRSLLGGLRRRLGGRPRLYLLRAAAERQHHDRVRGQAGRHADPGVLARDRPARRGLSVHRADRVPGDQEGGS